MRSPRRRQRRGYRTAVIEHHELDDNARDDGRQPVVGALIRDGQGRVFVHRRSPDRRFLPGCWDIVGGHVEPGERLTEALAREIREETGWSLRSVEQLLYVADWETSEDAEIHRRREFDFLVRVEGDLSRPQIEAGKHTDPRWVGPDDLELLDENRGADDGVVRHVVELALAGDPAYVRPQPHATIFVDPKGSGPIEALRRRWDPALAEQIPAHVTVTYPSEVTDARLLGERLIEATAGLAPFRLRLGSVVSAGDAAKGVFIEVHDDDRGHAVLRDRLLRPPFTKGPMHAHVTVVHPRTSGLGPSAWRELAGAALATTFLVRDVAMTSFDGRRWHVVHRYPLGSGGADA